MKHFAVYHIDTGEIQYTLSVDDHDPDPLDTYEEYDILSINELFDTRKYEVDTETQELTPTGWEDSNDWMSDEEREAHEQGKLVNSRTAVGVASS